MILWKFLIGAKPILIDDFEYANRLCLVYAISADAARKHAKAEFVEADRRIHDSEAADVRAAGGDFPDFDEGAAFADTVWLDHVTPTQVTQNVEGVIAASRLD